MPLSKPKLSLCALALPFTDLDEDIALAKAVGAGGLGLDENKLAADPAALAGQRERFVASGIAATVCAPAILSILPRDPSRDSGPRAPEERLRLIEGGIDKLAAFGADSVFCATGPVGDLDDGEARKIVVDGLRRLSKRAADAGTRFAVEPMREPFRPIWTIVNGLGQASELFEEVGEPLGIVFDTWHLWDSPDVRALIPANVDRIVGVQIADYRQPPRHIRDRVAAGEGVADLAGLVGALRRAGFDGWYDMEVFSDLSLEDSLWKLTPLEFSERQVRQFLAVWAQGDASPANSLETTRA
jgi:sugar phosphate isomerase/epimerase